MFEIGLIKAFWRNCKQKWFDREGRGLAIERMPILWHVSGQFKKQLIWETRKRNMWKEEIFLSRHRKSHESDQQQHAFEWIGEKKKVLYEHPK